jgi:hypothetical protein
MGVAARLRLAQLVAARCPVAHGWAVTATRFDATADEMSEDWATLSGSAIEGTFDGEGSGIPCAITTIDDGTYYNAFWIGFGDTIDSSMDEVHLAFGDSL